MQIAHRGLYVIVPHYLLDGQEITAILDHQRCWNLPEENMCAARLTDARLLLVVDNQSINFSAIESAFKICEK